MSGSYSSDDGEDDYEEEKPIIKRNLRGIVKWYNVDRGFGFIIRDYTHQELFVHGSVINNYNCLDEDDRVRFDIVMGDRGVEASNVIVL